MVQSGQESTYPRTRQCGPFAVAVALAPEAGCNGAAAWATEVSLDGLLQHRTPHPTWQGWTSRFRGLFIEMAMAPTGHE